MELKDYSLSFFEREFKAEKDAKVRLRLQMLLYLREGCTQREVSSILRVSVGIVPYWKTRFEKGGIKGLRDKAGRGRKPGLNEEKLSMLVSAIEGGVLMEDGYTRGWKTKDVKGFIQSQFGIKYTLRHCCRLLKNSCCSLKIPRPRNKSRNQEDVDKFKHDFKKKEKFWVVE